MAVAVGGTGVAVARTGVVVGGAAGVVAGDAAAIVAAEVSLDGTEVPPFRTGRATENVQAQADLTAGRHRAPAARLNCLVPCATPPPTKSAVCSPPASVHKVRWKPDPPPAHDEVLQRTTNRRGVLNVVAASVATREVLPTPL
jgi:hypothetical protein